MKIGFVRRGYSSTGGAERYLERLARGLVQKGHCADLYTSCTWPEAAWEYGSIVRLNERTPMRFARGVEALRDSCDVLFSLERILGCDVYRAGDGVHASWLRRRAAFEPWWRRFGRRWNTKHSEILRLERCMFDATRTGKVIANSQMVCDEIVQFYGYPRERIAVIPNGVPSQPWSTIQKQKGFADRDILLLFVGSGWERKGLGVLIEAVRVMKGIRLLVAGRGVWRRSVPQNVIFLGPVQNVSDLYLQADLFVLPTWYDPFSNACLEALSFGLPVITSTANGAGEVLVPGVSGDLVAPGDVMGLRDAIENWRTLVRQETVREACYTRGREFSIERNVEATLAVLEAQP